MSLIFVLASGEPFNNLKSSKKTQELFVNTSTFVYWSLIVWTLQYIVLSHILDQAGILHKPPVFALKELSEQRRHADRRKEKDISRMHRSFLALLTMAKGKG